MNLVEVRRVDAAGYTDDSVRRAAIDVVVDGESLSSRMGVAPFGVEEATKLGVDWSWLMPGRDVPLFNCLCGVAECGGVTVDVDVGDSEIVWLIEGIAEPLRFVADGFARSLALAMKPGPHQTLPVS